MGYMSPGNIYMPSPTPMANTNTLYAPPATAPNTYTLPSSTTTMNADNMYVPPAAPSIPVGVAPDAQLLTRAPTSSLSLPESSSSAAPSSESKQEVESCDCYDPQDPANSLASNFLYDAKQQRVSRINPPCSCEPHAMLQLPPEPVVMTSSSGAAMTKQNQSATSQDKAPTTLHIDY